MVWKWRKWNRATHRDLGYFFFGVTLIYAISGIAINHREDWNPNFIVNNTSINLGRAIEGKPTKEEVLDILRKYNEFENYKKYYFPDSRTLKVFLKGGSMIIYLDDGSGYIEKVKKRPIFSEFNYLHYDPGKWWTWYSDIYAVALILLSITGLFIVRGKNGITRRGAILTIAGCIIPLAFLLLYF